jgi:hypothetical protein
MTEESLASALQNVMSPAVTARARGFAAQVRADGAAIAARQLEAEFA